MSDHLPRDVRDAIGGSHSGLRRAGAGLCVHTGETILPVMRIWDSGFAVDAADAPGVRGHVDLYDGPRHLSHCLVVMASDQDGETVFDFKRITPFRDGPPCDYDRGENAPPTVAEPG